MVGLRHIRAAVNQLEPAPVPKDIVTAITEAGQAEVEQVFEEQFAAVVANPTLHS